MSDYSEFLTKKRITAQPAGFKFGPLHSSMRADQRDITNWLGLRGRAAAFTDCGTGKSFLEQEWSVQIAMNCGTVLNLAPLAVAEQSVKEAAKWGRVIHLCESQSDMVDGAVNITNYEKLHKFSPSGLAGIVLDESSILKSFDGATRKAITEFACDIPYRLAGTATPSPNDYTELGNHAEFLGIMSMAEMLATFFVHDGGETAKWRLKGHAENEFWKWLASWAVVMRKPSDLGYSDDGFDLPALNITEHIIDAGPAEGMLFAREARSLQERRGARRSSLDARVRECAELVNGTNEQVLVWCDLNDESELLKKLIRGAVEVKGSDKDDHRRDAMMGFADGRYRVLVSKPRICGFGMNFQGAHRMAFVGLSDSYEAFYQAIRREWRYGQDRPVQVDLFLASTETAVLANLKRKQMDAEKMSGAMVEHMKEFNQREIAGASERERDEYASGMRSGKNYPVTAMQRTKALGLLHKTVKTNRVMVRQGFADYLVTMRKPGEAEDRITGLLDCYVGDELDEDFTKWCRIRYEEQARETSRPMSFEEFKSIQIWQRYADPVWDDIDPSDTLQRESAREEKDERHIAPLQLQVIRRGIQLWTEKGDIILSPFGGIGSEGYISVQMGREAVICELKRSYFAQAIINLKHAECEEKQASLFGHVEETADVG